MLATFLIVILLGNPMNGVPIEINNGTTTTTPKPENITDFSRHNLEAIVTSQKIESTTENNNATLKILVTPVKQNTTDLATRAPLIIVEENKTDLISLTALIINDVTNKTESKPYAAVITTEENATDFLSPSEPVVHKEVDIKTYPTDFVESEIPMPDYVPEQELNEETALRGLLETLFDVKVSQRMLRYHANGTSVGVGSMKQQAELFKTFASFQADKLGKAMESYEGKTARMSNIQYLIRDHIPACHVWHQINRNLSNVEQLWELDGDTKIIIHGLTLDDDWTPEQRLKRTGYFRIGDEYAYLNNSTNVILVNWTDLSSYPHLKYARAVDSVFFAGRDVADFLLRLRERGLVLSRTHIIGHSLGAHVAGVAGNWIARVTGDQIDRITGLDPAGPLFVDQDHLPKDTTKVLDFTDARFVDIVHSNMGDFFPYQKGHLIGMYGSKVQAGHVDFYPDGGELQNDCIAPDIAPNGCSHRKSVNYFTRSIFQDMLSCPCDSWQLFQQGRCSCFGTNKSALLGERVSRSARGRYYLATTTNSIYMI